MCTTAFGIVKVGTDEIDVSALDEDGAFRGILCSSSCSIKAPFSCNTGTVRFTVLVLVSKKSVVSV